MNGYCLQTLIASLVCLVPMGDEYQRNKSLWNISYAACDDAHPCENIGVCFENTYKCGMEFYRPNTAKNHFVHDWVLNLSEMCPQCLNSVTLNDRLVFQDTILGNSRIYT